jgi:hypothetical protein
MLGFGMSKEKQALVSRDLALQLLRAKGILHLTRGGPDQLMYQDERLSIAYTPSRAPQPHSLDVWRRGERAIKVLSVIWHDEGRDAVVIHHGGSWEDLLKRLAAG